MKNKPYLVIYNAHKNSDFRKPDFQGFELLLFENPEINDKLCHVVYSKTVASTPIIFINADAKLPSFWHQRLLKTLNLNSVQLCSALTCAIEELAPLVPGDKFNGSVVQLDNILYLLQSANVIHSNKINFECFIVRDKTILNNFDNVPFNACNNLLVQSQESQYLEVSNFLDIGNQKPLSAHALADFQWRVKKYLNYHLSTPSYPLLDSTPIMLHITMNWGGGVHQWINDYIQHETKYHHLVLESNGEFFRNSHGESLSLHYANTKGIELQKFELQAPINITSVKHTEYNRILDGLISRFNIQQIVVSSLIGHSMECLQKNIATLRVFHDYFPSWPSLIANLEKQVISDVDVDAALALTKLQPFGLISKAEYLNWRNHLHKIYQSENVTLIAPSQSVVNNLSKIDSQCFQKIAVIPHAIEKFEAIDYQKRKKGFQILVLGRISPPKGQKLLLDIVKGLGQDYEFIFIGAGTEGEKYLNLPNIRVLLDYENKNLRDLLQDVEPDIALITSQTSETFNYILSELQQAGVCTLSTKFGALKERIRNGKTGFLCANNATAFIDKIHELKNNPAVITEVQAHLKDLEFFNFEDEIKEYRLLLGAVKDNHYQLIDRATESTIAAQNLLRTFKEKNHVNALLEETESSLEERTKWAKKLTKQLKKAEKNIDLERHEVKHLKQAIQQESTRMIAEIDDLKEVVELKQSEIEKIETEKQAVYVEKQAVIDEKQAVSIELIEVYNSRSWRVTRPMRRFTTWSRHKRNAVKFRWTQIKTFPSRAIRSLKTRGLGGTVGVVKNKLNKKHIDSIKHETITLTRNFSALQINSQKQPVVSIIIPVYNHFEHTYNCLKSISKLNERATFEVIVVDDCSSDETENLIKNISGIIYQRQKQNAGFIESCNAGAQLATGQYLMFLNNDTVVYDDWLDSLVAVFDNYKDAGLVGSKLVYPDNQLQEAGGIVFSDASGWNYGRLGNPDEPQYNHVREVDYCSGASILITTSLFEELGRFDERYKPAYYEDTDLAFAVRDIGKKVYYQPASRVTHFEGISSGTDLTAGMKKYQVVNQKTFKQKWAKQLAKQPTSGNDIELCRIHGQPKRILIFDACTPTPDQDSGSLRMINLIKILKELNYHVIFMPENLSHDKTYTQSLQQLGAECIYTPFIQNPVDYLKENGKYLDAVMLSRYYVAEPVMPFIREYCPKAQIIFDTVDLHYVRERRMAEISEDTKLAKMAEVTRNKELAVAKACDTTLVVSPYEVEVLAQELPDTEVKVLTNIHEIYGCRKPFLQRQDIMFIGGYQHTPNVDAVEWFVAEIFPLIEKQLPDLKFHIIGSKAPKHIEAMACENIIFHGFVEDIEPYMDDIRIAVAPLRYGAGVKGKVNMSMSYGQPVVGTKVAVEGMFTVDEKDCLMAETPEQFAQQVIRLYQDEKLWNQISQGGLANVQSYFSFAAAKKAIEDILTVS